MNDAAFASVWDAIEDTPAEAASMRLRAHLMQAIEKTIRERGWSQKEAARRFGVTQPRISDLVRGKINLFGLDGLVAMATAAGLQVEISIGEGPVGETAAA